MNVVIYSSQLESLAFIQLMIEFSYILGSYSWYLHWNITG